MSIKGRCFILKTYDIGVRFDLVDYFVDSIKQLVIFEEVDDKICLYFVFKDNKCLSRKF